MKAAFEKYPKFFQEEEVTMSPMTKQKLLTHQELAEFLNVHRATLHRWRSAEIVPEPLYIGDTPRWRSDEIEAWLEAGCPPVRKWKYEKLGEVK